MKTYPYIVRGKKPYQQFQFRCIIPNDLISVLGQTEFRISLGSSFFSHCKILSEQVAVLYQETRQGLKSLEIKDIKEFLRIRIRKQILHVHNNLNNKLHESSTLYSSGILKICCF